MHRCKTFVAQIFANKEFPPERFDRLLAEWFVVEKRLLRQIGVSALALHGG